MKFNKPVSIMLTIIMLLSTLISSVPVTVSAAGEDIVPLEMVSLTPQNRTSGEGVPEEVIIAFNQSVSINPMKENQIGLLYDKEGDGIPDDPVLVREETIEGEESPVPHDGTGGDKGDYTRIMSVDPKDNTKIMLNLSYGEHSLLEEDHVYRLNIYDNVIQSADTGEFFGGLGAEEQQDMWIFDTLTENEITSVEIAGDTMVAVGKTIPLNASVKNQYGNTIPSEEIVWTSGNNEVAIVDANGQVTGKSPGTVDIIAASKSDNKIKAICGITVEEQDLKAAISSQEPLAVASLTPENGATAVDPAVGISISFNKPVDIIRGSLTTYDVQIIDEEENISPAVLVANQDKTVYTVEIVEGELPLSQGHIYRIESKMELAPGFEMPMSTIQSQDGEETIEYPQWSFDTISEEEGLSVVELTPENGSSNLDPEDINIGIRFNKPIEIDVYPQFTDTYFGIYEGENAIALGKLVPNDDKTFWTMEVTEYANGEGLESNKEYQVRLINYTYSPIGLTVVTIRSMDDPQETITELPQWSINTYVQYGLPSSVEITGNSVMSAGSTIALDAMVKDDGGNILGNEHVTWSSDDRAVATVDPTTGEVTAKKSGTVTITAYCQSDTDVYGAITIGVEKEQTYDISITSKTITGQLFPDDIRGVAINDGILYAVRIKTSGEVWFYAYDLMGNKLWEARPDEKLNRSIVIPAFGSDGTIFIQCLARNQSNTLIYALNPDGTFKWQEPVALPEPNLSKSQPLLVGSLLIITTQRGVYGFDVQSGEKIWHYTPDNEGLSRASEDYNIYDNSIVYGSNLYVTLSGKSTSVKDGKVQVLDVGTGEKKWHKVTDESKLNSACTAVVTPSAVYITDDTGIIHACAPGNGTELTGDPLNGMVIEENTLKGITDFIAGPAGTLYAAYSYKDEKEVEVFTLRAINPNGKIRYTYTENFAANYVAVDDEGYVYYGKSVGDLAGGIAIIVVSPYGQEAGRIAPYGSSTSGYFNLAIEGNVLAAGRHKNGEFIVAQIIHGEPDTPASIELALKKDLGENIKESIGTIVRDAQGSAMAGQEVEWKSADPGIIEVVKEGSEYYFIGHQPGKSTTLTAGVKGTDISLQVNMNVVVKDPVPSSVQILDEGGNVIEEGITLEYHIPYTFNYRILDQYGNLMENEGGDYYFGGNNSAVGESYDGTITLPQPEEVHTSITVRALANVNVLKDIYITVQRTAPRYSSILPKEAIINLPGSIQLYPADQYDETIQTENIQWSSSDEAIASVDGTGKVTAKGYGTVTVTGTAGEYTWSREVRVVPTFGYEWGKDYDNVEDTLAKDSEGRIYYITKSNSSYALHCINDEGSENWTLPVNNAYVEAEGDFIYCNTKDDQGNIYLTCLTTQGTEQWKKSVAGNVGLQFGTDGTLYLQMGDYDITALDSNGIEKWNLTLDHKIGNLIVSAQGILMGSFITGNNSTIYEIMDNGSSGEVIGGNDFINIRIGSNGAMAVDENGVLYAYYQDLSVSSSSYGICAVSEGNILWQYSFNGQQNYTNAKLVIQDGTLYGLSRGGGIESSATATIHTLDMLGNLKWEKGLANLGVIGGYMNSTGDFTVDSLGNIYMPLRAREVVNSVGTWTQSLVVKLDSDGNAVQKTVFSSDRYGLFNYLLLGEDSVYVATEKYSLGYGQDILTDEYLLKLPLVNNAIPEPASLTIKAPKTSIIEGNYLQLSAEVYSQLGGLMDGEEVTWMSNNTSVAAVDEHGRVTGISAGDAYITAKSVTDNTITAVLKISVIESGKGFVNMDTLNEKTQKTIGYYKKTGVESDWTAFALGAVGEDINDPQYYTNGKSYVAVLWDVVSAGDNLGVMTDYERTTMAILSAAYDPHNFGGMNLIEKIYNYPSLSQGNNAVMWGLIALNAADATVPEGAKWNQDYLIDYLLTHKAGDGWTYSGNAADTDMTAMAIYALAPYYNERQDVKKSVDEAVDWLKSVQNENGSFSYSGGKGTNTESTAQVIMALTSVGIDPQGDDWTRSGGNPVSAMLEIQLSNGEFEHEKSMGSDGLATNQALQALAALKQFYTEGISTIFYDIPYNTETNVEPYLELISDINKLPEEADEITLKHEGLVKELRARYNALSKEDRDKVTNIDRLIRAERKIKILKDKKAPSINTTLKNQKVTSKTLAFTVKVMDEVIGEIKPTVKLNGNNVKSNGYSYTVTLKEGKNTITIIAVDDNNNKTQQTYTINYEPKKQQGGKDEGTNNTGGNNTTGGSSQTTGAGNGGGSQGEEDQDETPDNKATKHLREAISKNMEETQSGDTISIELEEGAVLDAEMLNKLKEKENVTVIFKGEGYTISFNTSDIGDYDEKFEMDINMSYTSDNQETIKEIIGSENALILHFDYHGELPVPMTVVVKLPDDLKDKDPLYLYYYNETTGEMEMVEEANLIIQDGYAQFTITHCSDYTITDAAVAGVSTEEDMTVSETPTPTEKAQETGINMTLIIILMAAVLLVGILAVVLYNRKKQNQ